MSFNLKNKKELTFLSIGILMLIIVILGVTASIQFLFTNLRLAVDSSSVNEVNQVRFGIEKFEELKKN